MMGVKFDGGVHHMGNQVNSGGSVGLDGSNDAASTAGHGISVHALGDIRLTSYSDFHRCNRSGPWAGIIKYPVLVN